MNKKICSSIFILFFSFIVCLNNVNAKKISEVNIGDYIRMTPTSTSYIIPVGLTGYEKNQEINPSELNLWRVIKKNDDKTIDVVSEYVSSTNIYFYGIDGYLNLVGGLNKIASQYANPDYVLRTRHIGYSEQIEKCSELSNSACSSDTGYEADINLLKNSIGILIGKTSNGTITSYFLPSRYVINNNTNIKYDVRFVDTSGKIGNSTLFFTNDTEGVISEAVRPILTLKADIELPISTITEDGKNFYDLDSLSEEDTKPSEDNNQESDNIKDNQNQDDSSKNDVENPNTGNFVISFLIFIIALLIILLLSINKNKKIFRL